MKNFFLQFVLISLLKQATAQSCTGDVGICNGSSFQLGFEVKLSEISCHDSCRNITENNIIPCTHYSYCESSGGCHYFGDCNGLDTSDSTCKTNEPSCNFCNIPGFCSGPHISDILSTETLSECSNACQNVNECKWYVYNGITKDCWLYDNCNLYDPDNCPSCLVSERDCLSEQTTPFTRLMVIGPYTGTSGSFSVEIIDLGGNGRSCPNMGISPVDFGGTAAFINGKVIVCNDDELDGDCYTHIESDDSWIQEYNTGIRARYSGGVMLNDNKLWWISGGYPDTKASMLFDGTDFTPYQDLRNDDNWHKMLVVNETTVIHVQGQGYESHSFDLTSKTWGDFPNLPNDKQYGFAGFVTYPDESRHIVAAGGYDKQTWIFDLDSGLDIWRPVQSTLDRKAGASVQFGSTFLAVGGRTFDDDLYINDIFEFNPEGEVWVKRDETLKMNGGFSATVLVPDDYAMDIC